MNYKTIVLFCLCFYTGTSTSFGYHNISDFLLSCFKKLLPQETDITLPFGSRLPQMSELTIPPAPNAVRSEALITFLKAEVKKVAERIPSSCPSSSYEPSTITVECDKAFFEYGKLFSWLFRAQKNLLSSHEMQEFKEWMKREITRDELYVNTMMDVDKEIEQKGAKNYGELSWKYVYKLKKERVKNLKSAYVHIFNERI